MDDYRSTSPVSWSATPTTSSDSESVSSLASNRLTTVDKNEYKDANLTCLTDLDCSTIAFGFIAGNAFYRVGTLKVESAAFAHHFQTLQFFTPCPVSKQKLRVDIRYAFISKLNFDVKMIGSRYSIDLAVVFTQSPLFYNGEQQEGESWVRYRRLDPRRHDREDGYWKKVISSSAFLISLVLTKSQFHSFLSLLTSTSHSSILYNPLCERAFNSYRFDRYYEEEIVNWPHKIRHCVDAIKACGFVGTFFLDYVLFETHQISLVVKDGVVNEQFAKALFTAMFEYLKGDITLGNLNDFNVDHYQVRQKRDDGFVMIRTVYVTPTRILLTLEEATMNCRGFRKLGVDNLIQVKFRDDTLSWFPADDMMLQNIIHKVCSEGIEIAGKKYHEFGGSSSLFREHGSYFYATDDKKEIVEKWKEMGVFKVEAAAKVQARIGQYFTSAREIRFKLRHKDVLLIPDYMSEARDSAGNQYCFSDGCGVISPEYAKTIADELQIACVPSAFQFRFAGYKGMVVVDLVDERLRGNGGELSLLLRNSQKKFDIPDTDEELDFEIVQWSAPAPSRLHGAFIAMIDAIAVGEGKQDVARDRIRELHNETFFDNIQPLISNRAFIATLEKLPKYVPVYKMKYKNLLHQPFFRGMIEANAVLNSRLLANKNQIAIPPNLGRAALGVVDTTGSLDDGQVFYQFTKNVNARVSGGEKILKLGRVGVTKSPIYHPGDIRFLEAVDCPALYHLVDVLVFPSRGGRPHTDEIGGGDLDGDSYTIFWDPALMFDSHVQANDYTAPSVEEIQKVTLDVLQGETASVRVQYLKNNNLEQLSTAHLAHLILHDPFHPDCEKLARKADKAVNFFKSGLPAEVLDDFERPGYWPKFMGKLHEPAFTNSHILCELYESAKTILNLTSIAQKLSQEHLKKLDLISLADVNVTDWHMNLYNNYKKEITTLRVKHQIKTEGELFANAFLDVPGVLKSYKDPLGDDGSASALVQRKVFEVFERYRIQMLNRFGPANWKEEMDLKYENAFSYRIPEVPEEMVETAKTFYAIADNDGQCFSFPWIAWEGLDVWWSSEPQHERDMEPNYEKEIADLIESNSADYVIKFLEEAKEEDDYPWHKFFSVMTKCFAEGNKLDHDLVACAADYFMDTVRNKKHVVPKDADDAFVNFLLTIIRLKGKFNSDFKEETCEKVYKVAKSTLISYAFFPQNKHFFGVKLHEELVNYPSFVISIPKFWNKEFENNGIRILMEKSGCEQVVTAPRKFLANFTHYTIMCRGTLESCQKLESMLTPVIECDPKKTIKEAKSQKGKEMQKLLREVFGFKYDRKGNNSHHHHHPPRQANAAFRHANSTSNLRQGNNAPFSRHPRSYPNMRQLAAERERPNNRNFNPGFGGARTNERYYSRAVDSYDPPRRHIKRVFVNSKFNGNIP